MVRCMKHYKDVFSSNNVGWVTSQHKSCEITGGWLWLTFTTYSLKLFFFRFYFHCKTTDNVKYLQYNLKIPYPELRYILFCETLNENFECLETWFVFCFMADISVVGGARSKQTNFHLPLKVNYTFQSDLKIIWSCLIHANDSLHCHSTTEQSYQFLRELTRDWSRLSRYCSISSFLFHCACWIKTQSLIE